MQIPVWAIALPIGSSACAKLWRYGEGRCKHRSFGRAVGVAQPAVGIALEESPGMHRRAHVAAEKHMAQPRQIAPCIVREEIEQPRREKGHTDAGVAHDPCKARQGEIGIGHDGDRASVQQRAPDFESRRVKGDCSGVKDDVVTSEIDIVLIEDDPRDAAVGNRNALRPARGTGRVHDVSRVTASDLDGRPFGDGAVCEPSNHNSCIDDCAAQVGDGARPSSGCRIDEDNLGGALGGDIGEMLFGIGRIERYIDAAGLQDRKHANDGIERARKQHAHDIALSDSKLRQVSRQGVGQSVELIVGETLVAEDNRRRLRSDASLLTYDVLERAVPVIRHNNIGFVRFKKRRISALICPQSLPCRRSSNRKNEETGFHDRGKSPVDHWDDCKCTKVLEGRFSHTLSHVAGARAPPLTPCDTCVF